VIKPIKNELTQENFDKMKSAITMLGRSLKVYVKFCDGCRRRPAEMGPCRVCQGARRFLNLSKNKLSKIESLKGAF